MNLDQMEFRCPDAEVIGNVVVKDYRLVFRGNSRGNGVASILPEQGEQVSGVLWSITEKCEKSLDYYEGYPYLYGKQDILVQCEDGQELYAAVYIMNELPEPTGTSGQIISGRDSGRMQAEWIIGK